MIHQATNQTAKVGACALSDPCPKNCTAGHHAHMYSLYCPMYIKTAGSVHLKSNCSYKHTALYFTICKALYCAVLPCNRSSLE